VTRTRRPYRFTPRLEALELRDVPAVSCVASGPNLSVLTVTGDGNNDDISLTMELSPFSTILNVTGNGGTGVTGKGGTPVTDGLQYAGVTSVIVKLNGGNDSVHVASGNFLGLTFEGGDGDDWLNIGAGAAADHVIKTVKFVGGNGNDKIQVWNGNNRILGGLTIDGGQGHNTVLLGINPTDRTTVGFLSIKNGDGTDTFTAGGLAFTTPGSVTIDNGSNANPALGQGSTTTFETLQNCTVGGPLKITNGAGDDVVKFGKPGSGFFNTNSVTIDNSFGSSDTQFLAAATTLTGNLSVKSFGTCTLTVQGSHFAATGSVSVSSSGFGFGSVNVSLLSEKTTQIFGGVTIGGGAGPSSFVNLGAGGNGDMSLGSLTATKAGTVTFAGENLDIRGLVKMTNASLAVFGDRFTVGGSLTSDGVVNIDNASTTIGGAVKVTSYTGLTLSSLFETNFRGTVTIENGPLNIVEGEVHFLVGVKMLKAWDFINGGNTFVTGNLEINADGGIVDNNGTLVVSGNLKIDEATNVWLDDGGVHVGGNLTVNTQKKTHQGLEVDSLVRTHHLVVGGLTAINTFGGNDRVVIDDSYFIDTATIKTGLGNDLVEIETFDTGAPSLFKNLILDLEGGDDVAVIGREFDFEDVAGFGGKPTFKGGLGNDKLTRKGFNQFPFGLTVLEFETVELPPI